jgi:calcineurin-like phosphoesterase family protein
MGKIWLISDLHFNHDKDFIWKARGFNSIQEMNEEIIKNFNSVVAPEDTVYILGDNMMGTDTDAGLAYLKRLNGIKYAAIGNHDTDARIEAYKKADIFADIQFGYRIKVKGKVYVLTHYPTVTANGEDLKVVNLYGHTHQAESNFFEERPYMYHVGLDSHNCFPVDMETIITDIKNFKEEK